MNEPKQAVSICIVTHNSALDIGSSLAAIGQLSYEPLDLVIVDCASEDTTLRVIEERRSNRLPTQVIELDANRGFSGGMNCALAISKAPFVLALNPDAQPQPDFVARLMHRASLSHSTRLGAITGRLLRPGGPSQNRRIDACGMYLVPTWRHLDRGSGIFDTGQWPEPQRVFGATAAAALYRREALEDVALEGEIFLSEFHSYREDAELCFRLCERRWDVLYEPTAICLHSRRNLPSRRSTMPAVVNMHSLKNRYLLRAYHQDLSNLALTLMPALWRDLLALAWVLVRERSSLAAYSWLWRNRRRILRRRRSIQDRRTCRRRDLNRWFFTKSRPL